jgi:erythromycin esterase-like protein
MTKTSGTDAEMLADVRALARPLRDPTALDQVMARATASRFVCIGEASHGTHDFYLWRAALSRRLIEDEGFTWIGVEGDWPDCWRINQWLHGVADNDLDSRAILRRFERWPTWMWANEEVADFLSWLRDRNMSLPLDKRVGFYGLDIYSLWDSLTEIILWLEKYAPASVGAAMQAWQCFLPYHQDPEEYGWSTRLVPETCEPDVTQLLVEVRKQASRKYSDADAFNAEQNAEIAAGAERYYRTMMRGGGASWNIRDVHMTDTVDRLARHLGPNSKGLIWAHNTHVGDARGTDMAAEGLINVGQLLRERHGANDVTLIGFATFQGSVVASRGWGAPQEVMRVPEARAGSHEELLHRALAQNSVLDFGADRGRRWLGSWAPHRAIGVVYRPDQEAGNYVPTRMGSRYDALVWIERTEALHPLRVEPVPEETEYETEPSGY